MSRKSPHKRQRKKDKGGSGVQWGSRTTQEVELMGQTKTADVKGIGNVATKNLKKAGIVELSEVDEFKDAKTGDILQKETKLSGRQVQGLVSAREHAKDIEIQTIRQTHKDAKSKRQKKLKIAKKTKREPRASSMKHFIKDYAYRRFKEHDVTAPSNLWDDLKDEIEWDGPVSSAWDITYAWMIEHGYETDKERLARVTLKQKAAGEQQTEAIIDEFERGIDHIEDQEEQLYSDMKKIAEKDTVVRKELVERSRSKRHFNKTQIRRLQLKIGTHKQYMDKVYEVGTVHEQMESEKKLKELQKEMKDLK